MFRAIFVRHALKKPGTYTCEYDVPIDSSEILVVNNLRSKLAVLNSSPMIWFSSYFVHARQTAEALLEPHARVVCVCGLTPFSADEGSSLTKILYEAGRLEVSMSDLGCIGFVGHEERLSNLAKTFVRDRHEIAALDHLGAVCVSADTLLALSQGEGGVEFRLSRSATQQR